MEVEAAFEMAARQEKMPPVGEYFEIRPYGHFSDFRSFAAAREGIQFDVSVSLRRELPNIFFDPAPVVIDDALATGTKYDAMLKLSNNCLLYTSIWPSPICELTTMSCLPARA